VEHLSYEATHFPSQQWNCWGEQILTTQSSLEEAHDKSGHLTVLIGQLSTVLHMKMEGAHSPPGQTTWLSHCPENT